MSYKPAIASMSLGRAWAHELPTKFLAAATAGLPAIEIFYEDLLYLANALPGGATPTNQLVAAHRIKDLCDSLHLEIMAIGPFSDFEGRIDPVIRAQKLQDLQVWFEVGRILGTDIIQIPCTFMTEGVTGDIEVVARDLREIADLGAKENPPYKFAYENLCWGTFNDTWEKAWNVVKAVDRENFGMCLDTFNIAGREYGDPASPTGKVENAEVVFRESMRRMVREIDVKKVFYVQVVDAERMSRPLDKSHPFHVEGQKPRMNWSRNSRLFICEEERGGYLPVVDVLKAICDEKEGLGYKGWISMELFNRSLLEEGEAVPKEHAERAMESWRRLVKAMGWKDKIEPKGVEAKSGAHVETAHEAEILARL